MASGTTSGVLTSGVTVSGETVQMVLEGLGELRKNSRHILSEYGLDRPRADQWYSHEDLTELLGAIASQGGPFTLYNAGMHVADTMAFPPQINSMEKALQWLGSVHERSHRGEQMGAYTTEATGMRSATVVSSSFYPCDFDLGLIETTARRFRPSQSRRVSVTHDDSSLCRNNGGDSCTYSVQW